jgi:phenol 2-monooxygenase (NADPH)
MANFPDIRTAVIDRKDGPLEVGRAVGVACRTVEMFDRSIWLIVWSTRPTGSTRPVWRPDPEDRSKITRTVRIDDVEERLAEMPHVIVNQA